MYIITLILNYAIGIGILGRLGISGSRWEIFGLAFPLGLGSATVIIFLLDVLGIPLSLFSITMAFLIISAFLLLPEFFRLKKKANRRFSLSLSALKNISLAEWIFLIAIAGLFLISFWRCFYLPVTPYDSIVGIDLVAKYAVEDGRIDSRMFSDLKGELSTQPYYAPFTALSQIIYRFSGLPFGGIWLGFMFLSLLVVFYINLRREIHPLLAGFLLIVLISIPELYAYTFLLQTDFSNAVFVSLSIIYAYRFIQKKNMEYFWVSALLFGFGVWTRSETVAFAAMTAVLIFLFLHDYKNPRSYKLAAYFFAISFIFFAIWNLYYLPVVLNYRPESYFKFGFWDPEKLAILWNGMLDVLTSTVYWGYTLYFFIIAGLINLLFFRDRRSLFILFWIILLFFSFLILLYHLDLNPGATVSYTFRRGSFKLWLMMIYYIGTSAFFTQISNFINTKLSVR